MSTLYLVIDKKKFWPKCILLDNMKNTMYNDENTKYTDK